MRPITTESTFCRPWTSPEPPRTVLAIRLHAIGDVAITLPYCAGLKKQFPSVRFDFLTSKAAEELPKTSGLFTETLTLQVDTMRYRRLSSAIQVGLQLRRMRYDVVLDLQRNWMSRLVRLMAAPQTWAEFDRFSPSPAGTRTQRVFQAAGFRDLDPIYSLPVDTSFRSGADFLLTENGWDGKTPLVVLNPAGLWESRNWPIASYRDLGRLWMRHQKVQFLLLGTHRIREKASFLQRELGNSIINLSERTSLGTALAVLQRATLVVSEDSGLLHMAWGSGIPTIALFGSSRADWSRPMGNHSACLSSDDLECGQCMQPSCRYGDVHCLTRYTPAMVLDIARQLLSTRLPGQSS